MNEIHEFMSKFREGVEVIWGVAVDNSLDTKVKITVLATGFGVEDVPVWTHCTKPQPGGRRTPVAA